MGRPAPALFRALLRLYSPSFRERFGAEALDVLRRDLDEAREKGGVVGLVRRGVLVAAFILHGLLDRAERLGWWARRHGGFWNGWGQDVRLAVRSTGRRLGFTLVAVLSLAVGVGANAVVFSVVDTFLLRDIPGAGEPDRIVDLSLSFPGDASAGWNVPDFRDVLDQVRELESAALFTRDAVSLGHQAEGRRVLALYVTSGYFRSVGVELRGRDFPPEVDQGPGAHRLVVLSHRTWQERFEGDPDIVGSTVLLNREAHVVLGVAAADFHGHQFGLRPAVYLPLTRYPPAVRSPERFLGSRETLWAGAVGRMAHGTEVDGLNAALRTAMARLEEAYPESNTQRRARAVPSSLLPAEGRTSASIAFALIGALMLLVLAAASANVGGMLLARASARQREMAIRKALGSGRARIVRHLVTEAMVVFLLGGTLGLLLAVQGLALFERASTLPTFLPVELEFVLDGRVLAFGMALTVAAGLVFGLVPSLAASRDTVTEGLRQGGGTRAGRLRRLFVAGQVGVSVLLLASAAVFLRSLGAGEEIELGFQPEAVYLTGFDLALEGYDEPGDAEAFLRVLLDRVRGLPEVAGAAVASDFPLDGRSSSSPVWPDGRQGEEDGWLRAHYTRVTDGYFETLGVPLLAGRAVSPDDGRATRPVVVVNRFLAEAAWPGESPLGRTLEFGLEPGRYEVVGVVGNTRADGVTDEPTAQVFIPVVQDLETELFLGVRQRGSNPDFAAELRRGILAVDPALAISPVRALPEFAALGMLPQRLVASIAGVLGAMALFLSALGVYGVVAFAVTQRTREIGVRMALGSSRVGVLGRVLADGLLLALPGFLVGLPLAVLLAGALRGMLVGVSPLDPVTYLAVTALFLAVVGAACLSPARRASRIEPARALREE